MRHISSKSEPSRHRWNLKLTSKGHLVMICLSRKGSPWLSQLHYLLVKNYCQGITQRQIFMFEEGIASHNDYLKRYYTQLDSPIYVYLTIFIHIPVQFLKILMLQRSNFLLRNFKVNRTSFHISFSVQLWSSKNFFLHIA